MSVTESPLDLRLLIDTFFQNSFSTDNPLITDAIRRMLSAGGKRLRPRLTLLTAQAVGGEVAAHIALASYIELIHVATLIHDDVVDGAEQRRGVNATAVDFGNQISVLAGDYLLAWIFKNVTANYAAPIPHILSATLAAICDGEVLQLRSLGQIGIDSRGYQDIVEKKTASLFMAATQCGAIVGGGSERQIRALAEFGRNVGTAFQIADDILDLTATQAAAGKPVGHDLIEGKVTLPLILALRRLDAAEQPIAAAFYAGDRIDPAAVLELIGRGEGIQQARHYADELLNTAAGALDELEPAARAPLHAIIDGLR